MCVFGMPLNVTSHWRRMSHRGSIGIPSLMGATVPTVKERSKERRWIVLGTDGRYVTLGRATDPSEEEVRQAEEGLRARGLCGWLAIMEGNPYVGAVPKLMEVRSLAGPRVPFEEAAGELTRVIAKLRNGKAD